MIGDGWWGYWKVKGWWKHMLDLIWVGNTLLPRGVGFGAAAVIALTAIIAFVYLTDERRP